MRRWQVIGNLALLMIVGTPLSFVLVTFLESVGEGEIVLLPPAFTGPVVILFDQAMGAPPKREGRERVYEIPPSGVLRTQFRENKPSRNTEFYYADAAGRRSPIPGTAFCRDSLPRDLVEACQEGKMSVDGLEPPAYTSYVVRRRRDQSLARYQLDSLVRRVVFGREPLRAP